ncbi:MAG: hypothetical protein VX893_06520 [Candidatus Latescibacterota bacterium]|nr:hypothetical protein [Candidatus Latescibacterota bacterium]
MQAGQVCLRGGLRGQAQFDDQALGIAPYDMERMMVRRICGCGGYQERGKKKV